MRTTRIQFSKIKGHTITKELTIFVEKDVKVERCQTLTILVCPNMYRCKKLSQFLKQYIFNSLETKDLKIYLPNDYIKNIREADL